MFFFSVNLGYAYLLSTTLLVISCKSTQTHGGQTRFAPHTYGNKSSGINLNSTDIPEALLYLIHSFETLQSAYFSDESGDYPSASDWTAAVAQTHAVTAIHSVLLSPLPKNETINFIDVFFPDIIALFQAQNVPRIRFEAFDDMLWVVLGWLAAVRFLDAYYHLLPESYNPELYVWRESFALRARQFYGYAERGWDELFCDGGLVWDPLLKPYKNAITNELFISASAQMYTTFPPEFASPGGGDKDADQDISYLQNAAKAYKWFKGSNFKSGTGLITDGFHISNYWKRKCDERDEQTFTYNQGVILSGLRALWETTANRDYLQDGYEIIESVIASANKTGALVRNGILEEHCDSWGWCSQDGQSFKGIFFHHLTAFCSPHPYTKTWTSREESHLPDLEDHLTKCREFLPFVATNAEAAWATRKNQTSIFGMWWSAPLFEGDPRFPHHLSIADIELKRDPKAIDLVNTHRGEDWAIGSTDAEIAFARHKKTKWTISEEKHPKEQKLHILRGGDLNDRFRGRSLETQCSGVGVMRALWELSSTLNEAND